MTKPLVFIYLFCLMINAAYGAYAFSTYQRPFTAQSLWNSKPVNPVFDATAAVPTSLYYPSVSSGAYSTGVFLAQSSDPSVIVYAPSGSSGVWNVDAFEYIPSITIPRFPADANGATGSDGHCDIVDPITNIIHSFTALRKNGTVYNASMYAWAPLNGRGIGGDAGHYYQGARAVGVIPSAGIIRKHEINDGAAYYPHALALSLTYNGLDNNPTYIYPAASADSDAANANTGTVPEGALLLLPSSFNTSTIANLQLRKVAETLKVYGAYVVDRNYGTPYVIYVENNSSFNLMPNGWDNAVAAALQNIRAALKWVVSASSWVDGNGAALNVARVNLLSMRGPNSWGRTSGNAVVRYDTLNQSLVYDGSNTQVTTHENWSKLGYNMVNWGKLRVNSPYRVTAYATGGAQLMLRILQTGTNTEIANSGYLSNGIGYNFNYVNNTFFVIRVYKPIGGPATIGATLYYNNVDVGPYLGYASSVHGHP